MKPKKKSLRTVELRFFQDDANGEWGVTHKETCPDARGDSEFNAFWDGRGLFHDVFEHAHEFTDKHFTGYPYALNIGGEVAAMGQLSYFVSQCGMGNRFDNRFSYSSPDTAAMQITLDMMLDQISHDSGQFGSALESKVPAQKDTEDGFLEWIIEEHFARIQKAIPYNYGGEDSEETTRCREYKESVTLEKLQNLYRYGWRMGEKMFPNSQYRNGSLMSDFVNFWNDFCEANPAEDMAQVYKGITFKIYRDENGLLYWIAEFVARPVPSYEAPPKAKFFGGADETSRVQTLDLMPEMI